MESKNPHSGALAGAEMRASFLLSRFLGYETHISGRAVPYSARKACIGSMRAARQAGRRQAAPATANSTPITTAYTTASRGRVAYIQHRSDPLRPPPRLLLAVIATKGATQSQYPRSQLPHPLVLSTNRRSYSFRNAVIGSMRVARHAGTEQATIATSISTAVTHAMVHGSYARTP